MNQERYEQLLAVLLDEELPPAAAAQLLAGLCKYPQLQRELRQQLILWEAWSQQVAQERSADSFVEAWKTRALTAGESEAFSQSVMEKIGAPLEAFRHRIAFWKRWRPLQIAFAVFALAFLAMAGWWTQQQLTKGEPVPAVVQLPAPGPDGTVTVTGEGVCIWCVLHEANHPGPAIRVRQGGSTRIVHLDFPGYSYALHHFFEGGTTVTAKGILREENGQTILATRSIQVGGCEIP
jgi:hypothetical protein